LDKKIVDTKAYNTTKWDQKGLLSMVTF